MMKRVLVPRIPKGSESVEVPESEAQHLLRVLRLGPGDRLEALDGKGGVAVVELKLHGKRPVVTLSHDAAPTKTRSQVVHHIDVALAILKADSMSWAIEKLCELGVRSVRPILAEFSVVKINKDPEAFRARWQETADQSLKQCGRLVRLEVHPPQKLETILVETTQTRWTALDPEAKIGKLPQAPAAILVGPEGGWSSNERELLARDPNTDLLSLPTNTLRAETAAVAAAAAMILCT